MARISVNNGYSEQSVMGLSGAEVRLACEHIAHHTDPQHPARAKADGWDEPRFWLEAFCWGWIKAEGAVYTVG